MNGALLLVLGGKSDLHAIIHDAARRVFSIPQIMVLASAEVALDARAAERVVLLVLVDQDATQEERIHSMPGFGPNPPPVVRLGAAKRPGEIDVVPPEEWSAPLLARVFRSTVGAHALARENARANGDLLTLGRRISHDLRTPLGEIHLTIEVLGEADPSHIERLQPISNSAKDMEHLIERVSFLMKASACPVPKTRTSMGDAVLSALDQLGKQIQGKQASVSQPPAWPIVDGVAAWLEVIWWNLVANSVQHAGVAPVIGLGWDRSEAGYHFWVRDNGSGISAEKQSKLFQPFHLLHKPGSARGLGLSIVQRLVELQGGHCRYELLPTGGAGFAFSLPGN